MEDYITQKIGDLRLSRLMLGTVQFGLDYGIANKTGQPSYETARDILACAFECGVNCLDTAAAYGTSEEVIGKAIHELGVCDTVTVVSKIPSIQQKLDSEKEVYEYLLDSVRGSLHRLQMDYLPICLFHAQDSLRYFDVLAKLRQTGLVGYIGSSIYTPDGARCALECGADCVQIPTNVLDHRFIRTGCIDSGRASGMAFFVRSIYLQGLLFLQDDEILPELRDVIPVREKLRMIAKESGLELAEMALRYVLSLDGVTSAVVGVDTVEQMRQNVELACRGPLAEDVLQQIDMAVPNLPDRILMPPLWSKRMPDSQSLKQSNGMMS